LVTCILRAYGVNTGSLLGTKRQAKATSRNKLTISTALKDICLSNTLPANHRHLKTSGGHADSTSIALAREDLRAPNARRKQPSWIEFNLF